MRPYEQSILNFCTLYIIYYALQCVIGTPVESARTRAPIGDQGDNDKKKKKMMMMIMMMMMMMMMMMIRRRRGDDEEEEDDERRRKGNQK